MMNINMVSIVITSSNGMIGKDAKGIEIEKEDSNLNSDKTNLISIKIKEEIQTEPAIETQTTQTLNDQKTIFAIGFVYSINDPKCGLRKKVIEDFFCKEIHLFTREEIFEQNEFKELFDDFSSNREENEAKTSDQIKKVSDTLVYKLYNYYSQMYCVLKKNQFTFEEYIQIIREACFFDYMHNKTKYSKTLRSKETLENFITKFSLVEDLKERFPEQCVEKKDEELITLIVKELDTKALYSKEKYHNRKEHKTPKTPNRTPKKKKPLEQETQTLNDQKKIFAIGFVYSIKAPKCGLRKKVIKDFFCKEIHLFTREEIFEQNEFKELFDDFSSNREENEAKTSDQIKKVSDTLVYKLYDYYSQMYCMLKKNQFTFEEYIQIIREACFFDYMHNKTKYPKTLGSKETLENFITKFSLVKDLKERFPEQCVEKKDEELITLIVKELDCKILYKRLFDDKKRNNQRTQAKQNLEQDKQNKQDKQDKQDEKEQPVNKKIVLDANSNKTVEVEQDTSYSPKRRRKEHSY